MADTKEFDPKTLGEFERSLFEDYSRDKDAHDDSVTNFDAYEAMHRAKTYDAVSGETSNGLTDSMTATIYLERAARVAGQLPEGEVQAFGKKDKGKGLFMDILRQKWIYPNANAQHPFRTKMFLLQYGSSEYGYAVMHYDLNSTPSGYFGPDCWVWNPRMFIPQDGFVSISDMDYCHALAVKGYGFLDDILDEESDNKKLNKISGWKFDVIRDLKKSIENRTLNLDSEQKTLAQKERTSDPKQLLIATRYEAGKGGRWISFLPEYGYKVIRNIPNPHKNGRIPFVIKPCIPDTDTFYGVGDFQRSMPMQFANDGLTNFYFEGLKMNIFPPTVVNAQTIIRHTMSQTPASVWETNGNVNDVKRLETSTAGLATYQNAKGEVKGSLQSIAGTTDTRANRENASDPGFGKTPEALKMMQMRESTRDNLDRQFLEEAMKELLDGMLSLIPIIKEHIPIDLFVEEIEEIAKAGHDDIMELFEEGKKSGTIKTRLSDSETQVNIKLNPEQFKGLIYRFELVPNSTAKKTKEAQLAALLDFLNFMGKMPNALEQYQASTGKVPNWEKIFAQYGSLADIDGMDDMFTEAPKPKEEEQPQQQGISPEMLAQASAMPPEQIAQGGMMPQAMPPQMPQQMPMQPMMPPQPQPQMNPELMSVLQEYQMQRGM